MAGGLKKKKKKKPVGGLMELHLVGSKDAGATASGRGFGLRWLMMNLMTGDSLASPPRGVVG